MDLTGRNEVLSFTDLTVRASSDVVKAEVAYSLFSETVDFHSGSANVNVREIMGALDTGEPGISILSIKGLGIDRFTVTLIDGSGGSAGVTIRLLV